MTRLQHIAILAVLALASPLASAREGYAQANRGRDVENDRDDRRENVVILSASYDRNAETLTLVGDHFGRAPRVWLGVESLRVIAASSEIIHAFLPSDIEPASYVLTVNRGRGDNATATFIVAIVGPGDGQPGPTGPEGPQGEIGPTGPTGAQGPQGEIGPVGPTGPQGPQGESGAPGSTGLQGSPGPQGEPGPTGPQGAQGATGSPGAPGATGPQGATGAVGVSGYEIVQVTIPLGAGQTGGMLLSCPGTKRALSGGVRPAVTTAPTAIVASYPQNAQVWNTQVQNQHTSAQQYTFFVVCASAAP